MISRVRVENQPSSERENVVVAATARMSAGSAAMIENKRTMRTCSRLPAILRRHARQRTASCMAITTIIAAMSTMLMSRTVTTTSLRGTTGVRPVRMR